LIRAIAAVLILSIAAPAEAAGRRHRAPESSFAAAWHAVTGALSGVAHSIQTAAAEASPRASYGEGEVVPHPSGCPRTAFCGCGVAVKVFGEPRRDLWPSSAWRRFPRASCAPGRVAVWSGHVAAIVECLGDGTARLYDPNSGGGLTRIDVRPLPALIVDPRGG
jgi:hypothetical protein